MKKKTNQAVKEALSVIMEEYKPTTNLRNGSYRKKARSTMGELELSIPRDRDGAFEPELVPTGTKDVSGLEEKV